MPVLAESNAQDPAGVSTQDRHCPRPTRFLQRRDRAASRLSALWARYAARLRSSATPGRSASCASAADASASDLADSVARCASLRFTSAQAPSAANSATSARSPAPILISVFRLLRSSCRRLTERRSNFHSIWRTDAALYFAHFSALVSSCPRRSRLSSLPSRSHNAACRCIGCRFVNHFLLSPVLGRPNGRAPAARTRSFPSRSSERTNCVSTSRSTVRLSSSSARRLLPQHLVSDPVRGNQPVAEPLTNATLLCDFPARLQAGGHPVGDRRVNLAPVPSHGGGAC